jgi:LuxR family transcriptional regulator, maltose regulon positive regulatory protein
MRSRWAAGEVTQSVVTPESPQTHVHADPALSLKVMPPRPRKDMLVRQRLDLPFSRYADVPVVVAEAPAGYGKTLLLAQWRRTAMARGASAAWLTLDERDDERRLLEGLTLSLRQATGRADLALGLAGVPDDPEWGIKAAAGLLAEWSRLARPVVLLLDDFDRLTSEGAREIGRYVVANLPTNGRILMGMRGIDSRPWVLELQAYGQLSVVNRSELAFTLEESIAFLEQRLPGGLADNIAAQMYERTGGWPLGLELFVASITAQRGARSSLHAAQIGSGGFRGALV